ncbi:MAG: GDSL-type esterase/lipase family protein [Kiritimatiellae bacterium]|nr:GDSL-type esterase/lipase family protein [Kiritimatiellia bacterium]
MKTFPLLLTPLLLFAEAPAPLRILCIGDSITHGGHRGRAEYTYRLPLARTLHEQGIPFEMHGTQTEGLHPGFNWPDLADGVPFPARHEGYYAYTTDQLRHLMRENLPKIPPPDVALIHLGTNDQRSRDYQRSIIAPLEEIIARLRERNPNVIVLVGHLNFNEGPALRIRPLKTQMARKLNRPDSPVLTVPHYQGWIANPQASNPHTYDWLHPNPAGQEKMAHAWLQELDRAMEMQADAFEPEEERAKRLRTFLELRQNAQTEE